MAYASREIAASPADVYAVLIDPRSYPSWLAGAKEIRRSTCTGLPPAVGSTTASGSDHSPSPTGLK